MTIGVDLRALQIGHQYRGIGEVVKRTLNEMFIVALKDNNSFVFYTYDNLNDPTELLDIPSRLKFEVVSLGSSPDSVKLSRSQKFRQAVDQLYGNPIRQAKRCDVFLQYDYALGIPKGTRTVLIKHDIIPFIFWDQFFESPMVAFKNKAARTTIRTIFHNYRSKRILARALKNAHRIVTVSEYTRQDLHRYFKVPLKKMTTIHLGVSAQPAKNTGTADVGKVPEKPFLLFIGAVDKRRRRVDDLVAAYNSLKADGHDIQLVLAGENFSSPESVPEGPVRAAIQGSSYGNDILTLGYIDDATKQYLFKNAIAFVFPTKYEGFGIPILEAMLLECPIIAYNNSSVPEVGGEHVLYANDWMDIKKQTEQLLAQESGVRQRRLEAAKRYAAGYEWSKTAGLLYKELSRK